MILSQAVCRPHFENTAYHKESLSSEQREGGLRDPGLSAKSHLLTVPQMQQSEAASTPNPAHGPLRAHHSLPCQLCRDAHSLAHSSSTLSSSAAHTASSGPADSGRHRGTAQKVQQGQDSPSNIIKAVLSRLTLMTSFKVYSPYPAPQS